MTSGKSRAAKPRIVKSQDCGNSPKNLLVQSLAIAIETSNAATFSRCVSDDLIWAISGRRSFSGRAAALAFLKLRKTATVKQLRVRRAISHGRAGAADGTLTQQSGLVHSFCHVVDYSSTKGERISSISSFYSDLGDEA